MSLCMEMLNNSNIKMIREVLEVVGAYSGMHIMIENPEGLVI